MKFDSELNNTVSTEKLKKIYSVLANEDIPFAADVSGRGQNRNIKIRTAMKDVEHFRSIIKTD